MRLGLDLRNETGDQLITKTQQADELGLWAILIGGRSGTESNAAAQLATLTEHIHVGMWIDGDSAHPHTLAEEIAIVDHLSRRRVLAVIEGNERATGHVRDLLVGRVVDDAVLAPPPAQTAVPVWAASEVATADLTGDLAVDRVTIDEYRDGGESHLFVSWPGPLPVLARHLATRAATPNFPQIVADQADLVAPYLGAP